MPMIVIHEDCSSNLHRHPKFGRIVKRDIITGSYPVVLGSYPSVPTKLDIRNGLNLYKHANSVRYRHMHINPYLEWISRHLNGELNHIQLYKCE